MMPYTPLALFRVLTLCIQRTRCADQEGLRHCPLPRPRCGPNGRLAPLVACNTLDLRWRSPEAASSNRGEGVCGTPNGAEILRKCTVWSS